VQLSSSSLPTLPGTKFDFDVFASAYREQPDEAVQTLIYQMAEELTNRVSTKRYIEKANYQYVDNHFQRAATYLTAQVNQKVLARHHQIQSEIATLESAVDGLKDQVSRELSDMRGIIQDCRSLLIEIKHARDVALLRLSNQQRGRLTMRQKDLSKKPVVLLRDRKNVQADSVEVSLSLQVTKPA
jgi:hypothetical protein